MQKIDDQAFKRWQALGAVLRVIATVLIVFWLAVGAIVAGFHWIIVPRLATWKPQIERMATQATGLDIRIESLGASAEGPEPLVFIHGLSVRDAVGTEHLWVGSFEGRWSPSSLLNLGFSKATVSDWRLRIERDAQSRFTIAGLTLQSPSEQAPQSWANWLFKQPAMLAKRGTVIWQDGRLADHPEWRFDEVDLLLTNRGTQHALRVAARPEGLTPDQWSLQAQLHSPLLAREAGDWTQWTGQIYWDLRGLDWAWLASRIDTRAGPLARLERAQGNWRAWVDVTRGKVTEVTSDVDLSGLDMQWSPSVQALAADQIKGRLLWRLQGSAQEIRAQGIHVTLKDGLRWRGGDISWRHAQAVGEEPEFTEVSLRQIDLPTVSALAMRLPPLSDWHQPLQSWQPQGEVVRLQASWNESWERPARASVEGEIKGLGWQSVPLPAGATAGQLGRPGVGGLDIQFKTTELEGTAQIAMRAGYWDLPGVWAESRLPVEALKAGLSWRQRGGAWQVSARDIAFRNADIQVKGQVDWDQGPLGGELGLNLQADQAQLKQLSRYMPLVVPRDVRDYLKASVSAGVARQVQVHLKGRLDRLPFDNAKDAKFSVEGDIENAVFEPAPRSMVGQEWVRLADLSGHYRLDRNNMSLTKTRARWQGRKDLLLTAGEARISDWSQSQAQLQVQANAKGPVSQWLRVMQQGGLQKLVQGELDTVQANAGDGALNIAVHMPLAQPDQVAVTGQFVAQQATVKWGDQLPAITGGNFDVDFSPRRVRLNVARASWLGSPLSGRVELDAQGEIQGALDGKLRFAEWQRWMQWPDALNGVILGETPVRVALQRRVGEPLQANISSDLVGASVQLPAPLAKPSAVRWPLKGTWRSDTNRMRWTLTPISAPSVEVLIDPSANLRQGILAWGLPIEEAQAVPAKAPWMVAVRLPKVNVDEWTAWWSRRPPAGSTNGYGGGLAAVQWLTTINDLTISGWKFHDAQVDALWQSGGWQANVRADEMQGQIALQVSDKNNPDGRVFARLRRLRLNPDALDREMAAQEQPRSMPALDVQVEELTVKNQAWGQVKLAAENTWVRQGQRWVPSWEVKQLSVAMPEASFEAVGAWKPQASALSTAAQGQWRRTELDWRLNVNDAGALLQRFGMAGVLRGGKGDLRGRLAWQGSPLKFDKPTLSGELVLNLGRGQFLKAEPGIAKLLGVLSLQSLPRRLLLDFRDVFQSGFGFDEVKGSAQVQRGLLSTRDLTMKGPTASVIMEGSADIVRETQDIQVVVVPELDAGALSLWAGLTNPVLGLASYVAQKVFGDAVAGANVRAFHVSGPWQAPEVTPVQFRTQPPVGVRSGAASAPPVRAPADAPPSVAAQ